MIKLEFDPADTHVARAFGNALLAIAGEAAEPAPVENKSNYSDGTTELSDLAGKEPNKYLDFLEDWGLLAEAGSDAEINLRRAHGIIEQQLGRPVELVEFEDEVSQQNLKNPQELVDAAIKLLSSGGSTTQSEKTTTLPPEDQSTTLTTQAGHTSPGAVAKASGKSVDEKGVGYDPEYCADAAKPFYSSGARKGQWKKRGGKSGPTEEAYDNWYADQLLGAKVEDTEQSDPEPKDAAVGLSQAFGPAATDEWGDAPAIGQQGFTSFLKVVADYQTANPTAAPSNAFNLAGINPAVDMANPEYDWKAAWGRVKAKMGV